VSTMVDSPQVAGSRARVLDGRYELREVIAVGGAGTVWRATDRRTGEPVAVKVLNSEAARQPDVVAAFRYEAELLAGLDHPGVVRARGFVATGDDLALVMDLVPGTDLRALLRRDGPLAPAAAADVLGQVCAALAAVHAAGIVHGDVKPNNILVPPDRGSDRVRLVDFGVAHRIQNPTEATHATPEYVAPEVVDGGSATTASDVYGLGLVLYEALVGRSPYRGGSMEDVLRRHARCEVVRIAGIPDELWCLIESCLVLDPARRPSAANLAGRLRAVAGSLAGLPPLRVPAHAATYRPRGTAPAAVPTVPRQAGPASAESEEKPVAADDSQFTSLDDLMGGGSREPAEPASAEPWARPESVTPWPTPDLTPGPAPQDEPTAPIAAGTAAPWLTPPPATGRNRRTLALVGGAAGAVVLAGVLIVGGWAAFGGSSSPHHTAVADRHHATHSAAPSPSPTHPHRSPATDRTTSPTTAPSPTGPARSPNPAPPENNQQPTTAPSPSTANTGPGIGNPMPTMP
jgi:serine/threonine protein kinase, bacterial